MIEIVEIEPEESRFPYGMELIEGKYQILGFVKAGKLIKRSRTEVYELGKMNNKRDFPQT